MKKGKVVRKIAAAVIAAVVFYNYKYAAPELKKLSIGGYQVGQMIEPVEKAVQQTINIGVYLAHPSKRVDSGLREDMEINADLYYNYRQLPENLREEYLTILTGLNQMSDAISVQMADQDSIWTVYLAVLNDHPEIFWANYAYQGSVMMNIATLTPEYNCTQTEKEDKELAIRTAAENALAEIGDRESDYERAKGVFDYIIDTVVYDQDADDNQNLYSALVGGRSVCAGYSREAQYLLQLLGMEALYVTGEIRGQGAHAWNIVRCDGDYYQLDVTFGDRAFSNGNVDSLPATLYHDYTYLCCSDLRLQADRTTDDDMQVPACTSEALDFYQKNDILFDEWGSAVKDRILLRINEGQHYFRCRFSSASAYQEARDAIAGGWYGDKIQQSGIVTGSFSTWSLQDDANRVICLWY